jgi:anti-anti-sigma factor
MTVDPAGEQRSDVAVFTAQFDRSRASVHVTGHLQGRTAGVLEAVLGDHLRAGRRYVRLDVSGLRDSDAAGLQILLDTHHRYLANRGTLVLTGLRPPILRQLHRRGLDDVLLYTTADCHNLIEPPGPLSPVGVSAARRPPTADPICTSLSVTPLPTSGASAVTVGERRRITRSPM